MGLINSANVLSLSQNSHHRIVFPVTETDPAATASPSSRASVSLSNDESAGSAAWVCETARRCLCREGQAVKWKAGCSWKSEV